ncbi:putative glycoside hydrolase [Planococcus lenghuensis]|uniref:GTP-binding protein n=1 Tax=Planococcus lenghuensis TaxID=2213202 RepID=A0A1Q2L0G9_9BACL|nr:putative glycoside hydrolase [Planococcus lenghuensis]AQQ53913.1 GTP-binding protein [Planococcus lenghuensis]
MKWLKQVSAAVIAAGVLAVPQVHAAEQANVQDFALRAYSNFPINPELVAATKLFYYDSGLDFTYPDAVRGIFLTGHSAGGARFSQLADYVESTDLNAMVIDIKDDFGHLTYEPEEGSELAEFDIGKPYIADPRSLLEEMEEREIYPIARIVVFKDTELAERRPELSYTAGGEVWKNGRGEAFVNPYMKEVWDYNVQIAIEAAKMGFQEIQFDYVRFPEGFGYMDEELTYSRGDYEESDLDSVQSRVQAVTDFVAYAEERLEPYGVDVSVDIFGYAAMVPEEPNIGQNFSKISENVDVISAMIYPSHWGPSFGLDKPDLYPYELIDGYAEAESARIAELENPPVSRPWIQDFTASYLGSGNYKVYGPQEVEAQIKALKDNGINEYLLWNAGNKYTNGVDYTP